MHINTTSTRYLKLQNIIFVILFLSIIGLLAYLSNRYVYLADWTTNGQNSLNDISLQLLKSLDSPVNIVSYTNNDQIKKLVGELIKRYQREKSDISLAFVDPDADPEKIRALKISIDGEIIVRYQGREENLTELSEQNMTNALYRLLRAKERKVVFLKGHGERSPERQANFDLSSFSRHLSKLGFQIETLNLAKKKYIPDNISVLVIAGPQVAFLPGEVNLLLDYVKTGGNLLWLGEPLKITSSHPMFGLLPLSELLGIEFLDGVVVDPTTQQYNISRPDYAIITDYPDHPVNADFSNVTLFPQAAGIERLPSYLDTDEEKSRTNKESSEQSLNRHFDINPLLLTIEHSWVESSPIKEKVHFSDLLDIPGPIAIAMVGTRQVNIDSISSPSAKPGSSNQEQRFIVLGDGDFLSNTYLGNAGNLSMGVNLFNWLSHDEQFIAIPIRVKDDVVLEMSPNSLSLLGVFFLFAMPGFLITSGSVIWLRRRNN
jgi:hypothetical protein